MAGPWDAEVKLLYPVDADGFFAVDTIASGTPFVAVANVEIGENANENVDDHHVRVSVRNLTTSTVVATGRLDEKLVPRKNEPMLREVRVPISGSWSADDGDILELVASYRVVSGVNTAYSSARSQTFIATAKDA